MNALRKFLDGPIDIKPPETLLEKVIYEKARRFAARLDTVPNLNIVEAYYMGGIDTFRGFGWQTGMPLGRGPYVVFKRFWGFLGKPYYSIGYWNGSTWNIWGKVLRFKPVF